MNHQIWKSERKGAQNDKIISERERERSFLAVNANVNAKKSWFTNALENHKRLNEKSYFTFSWLQKHSWDLNW